MKFRFGRAVRREIASKMAADFPGFERLDDRDDLLYRSIQGTLGWSFVRFQMTDRGREAFTVELARSPDGRWPGALSLTIPLDLPGRGLVRSTPGSGACRFRIGYLFPPHADHWWELTPGTSLEEIMDWMANPVAGETPRGARGDEAGRLTLLVGDSLIKIRDYALPYLTDPSRAGAG